MSQFVLNAPVRGAHKLRQFRFPGYQPVLQTLRALMKKSKLEGNMTTTLLDQLVTLIITILGVFIALFLDSLVSNIKARVRIDKIINSSFVELQNSIAHFHSFIVGIDQNVEPFNQKPAGSFLDKNMPEFVQTLEFLISNEDLVEFASSKNLIALLNDKKYAKTFHLFLSDLESLKTNENVKAALIGLIREYQRLSFDLINIFYCTEQKYKNEIYEKIIIALNKSEDDSIYLKKNNKEIVNILKSKM